MKGIEREISSPIGGYEYGMAIVSFAWLGWKTDCISIEPSWKLYPGDLALVTAAESNIVDSK